MRKNLALPVSNSQASFWALCWPEGRHPQTGWKGCANLSYIPAMSDIPTGLLQKIYVCRRVWRIFTPTEVWNVAQNIEPFIARKGKKQFRTELWVWKCRKMSRLTRLWRPLQNSFPNSLGVEISFLRSWSEEVYWWRNQISAAQVRCAEYFFG